MSKTNLITFNKLFNKYYDNTYHKWRINQERAGKDIVGKEYEKHRVNIWGHFGFSAKPGKVANYNADLIIKRNNKIIAFEECKGHYVDACFFTRFISNAASIVNLYIKKKEQCPYIILSCPTTFNKYQEKFDELTDLFREDLRQEMKKKIIYMTYCEHDRVDQKLYFKNTANCFNTSDKLLQEQIKIIKNL